MEAPTAQPVDHSKRGHSLYSPSGYKNLKMCPGWLPSNKTDIHPVTAEGTLIHEAIDSENFDALDDNQWELALRCLQTCESYERAFFGPEYATRKTFKEAFVEVVEEKKSWGYMDRLSLTLTGTKAVVADWKFGWNKIDPADHNYQLRGYVLGVFKAHPEVQEILGVFVQPRLNFITTCHFERDTDYGWIDQKINDLLDSAAHWAMDPVASSTPGFSVCEYCGRKLTCPIMSALTQTVVEKLNPLLPVDDIQWEQNIVAMPMSSLDKLCRVLPLIEDIVEMAKKEMAERLKKGEVSSVYELTLRKSKDTVTNLEKAQIALASIGITGDDFEKCLTLSVSDLKKIASTNAPRGQKSAAENRVIQVLAQAGALQMGEEKEILTRKK